MDRIDHHEHGLDGRIVAPEEQVPGLIGDPLRHHVHVAWQRRFDESFAERSRSVEWRIKNAASGGRREMARPGPEVPVQQEQRREPLLTVEWAERSIVDGSVDEVEADRC